MSFKVVSGGFDLDADQQALVYNQRAITAQINNNFIQVGAVFLKTSNKSPYDDDWYKKNYRDTDLQGWIDNEDLRYYNVGFNLQLGWVDVDIDTHDSEYKRCIVAAMNHLRIDTRFQFGRLSSGVASHVMVQLSEEESPSFNDLVRFEPRPFNIEGERFHVQIRSMATNTDEKNIVKTAKQTVMPGSIYTHKTKADQADISVWFTKEQPATKVQQIAATTPRKVSFSELVRAITFGTFLYCVKNVWVEGERQASAQKIGGWLARVVRESQALNNQEAVAKEVFCPVDTDDIAESMIALVCDYQGDDEKHMRIRAYYDAVEKLDRNPDAKIPGWPAMEALIGAAPVLALRTVLMPGSDVSNLTKLAERYVYDESDGMYIDRQRFFTQGNFVHDASDLERRHKGDTIRVGNKPKAAFGVFEASDLRKRVGMRDLYPDLAVGGIYRIASSGDILTDEDDLDPTELSVFNTWRGWPIDPTFNPDATLMADLEKRLDTLFGYLTRDNKDQIRWIKEWIAYTLQFPGTKQQIAWVVIGEQGVGKSWVGNILMKALMGNLWGTASPKVLDGDFSVEPFINKMFTFIDEAKFSSETGVEEIKKLIRNVDVGGAEKFSSARTYRIFSRMMFASNRTEIGVGQANIRDRALFYTRTYDKEFLNLSETEFRAWAETLKPWFTEFTEMLERKEVREHLMRYFMDMPVSKYDVESIKYSSSNDPAIVMGNMTFSRRIAKYIIENGRIIEDLDLTYPFVLSELSRRVQEVSQEMGFRNVQVARVLHEFEAAGLVERVVINGQRKIKFSFLNKTTIDKFSEYIGTPLEPQFEWGDDDRGINENDGTKKTPWRGTKRGVVEQAKF